METGEYAKMASIEDAHWWFVAKRRFLDAALRRKFTSFTGITLLDVGCGTGAVMKHFKEKGASVVGVDMSPSALEFCKQKGLDAQLGTAEHLPFADSSFDAVIASDVLEHVSDHVIAVREIHRVLKPGGVFVSTVPAHQFLFSYHDTALHHVRRYSRREFTGLVRQTFPQATIAWIHSGILLPACLVRLVSWLTRSNGGSDVRATSALVNRIMGLWYRFELFMFSHSMLVPFGLSLMGIATKEL